MQLNYDMLWLFTYNLLPRKFISFLRQIEILEHLQQVILKHGSTKVTKQIRTLIEIQASCSEIKSLKFHKTF